MTNPTNLPGVMLNAYPDSIGADLSDALDVLALPEFEDVFSRFYVLPTFFNSDLDRGFSVIDYDLNEELVSSEDIDRAAELNLGFKFDLVLNHLSVNSPQFQDLIVKGDESRFRDFFIDWNEFWEQHGEMGPDGVIMPRQEYLDVLFMRKPGLPVLMVQFPDGSERPYWNTFYQEVWEEEGERRYLGQMDLNSESEKVWEFYAETLAKLRGYGAKLVRLDAFAYLHKQVGMSNFFNKPGTWDYLARLRRLAETVDVTLLPEIHSAYGTAIHRELSAEGYPIYDFFFPGLVIDALDTGRNEHLLAWIDEIVAEDITTVNMLGCHDGIPVIDLQGGREADGGLSGLLSGDQIDAMVTRLLERGGRVKNLYGPDGTKVSYYQVNATFFSALGEDEQRLRLARAIQLFMPGTPQVWYLDLFAGPNDDEAADRAGSGGHKEINRTNLSRADVDAGLERSVVLDQLEMLRLRNTSPAFGGQLHVVDSDAHRLVLTWRNGDVLATLDADLRSGRFAITHQQGEARNVLSYD